MGNITQLGMRNMGAQSLLDQVKKLGTTVVPCKQMHDRGAAACVDEFVPESEFLYVTIDTDVFDWSIIPGTAVPELGGLTLEQMRECMQVLVRKGNVIGFDIVCLNPMADSSFYGGITVRLTSYAIAYFLGYIFDARQEAG